MNNKMTIKIFQLQKKISDNIIFDNISIEIRDNDILGIIGPNGSGKTVFLKSILGIFTPTKGKITFEKDLEIGYYLNNNLLFTELNVINNIKTYSLLKNGKFKKKKINLLLEVFGLNEMKNKMVRKLSSGEKQRLALLISLINFEKLDLLILDEPFNFVDKHFKNQILEFILKIKCTKIIATHSTEHFGKYFTGIIEFKKSDKMEN